MLAFYLSILDTEDERNTFTELYRNYESAMYNIAYSILHDRFLAEDAVHDALIKLINYIPEISKVQCHKTKALIVIIIKSTAIDIYRKRSKLYSTEKPEIKEEADSGELPLDHIIADEDFSELKLKLKNLNKEYLEIILLKYTYDLTNQEIGNILCISNDAVRQRLSRAKKAVKKIIEEENQ